MIIRSKRTESFTVINNDLINDDRLDWKEIGLLVYLLSKPNNWQVCPVHLAKQRKTGRDGIYTILKSLRNAGYVEMQKQADGKTDWVVFDTPREPNPENTDKEKPNPEKPDREKPDREIPTLINTDNQVKTETNPPLAGEMKNCFDWATQHPFWSGSVTSISKFLELYGRASPNGLKAQYQNELAKQSQQSEASNAAHQSAYSKPRKLTPAERVIAAAGYSVS